jgi:hypothetical protein
MAYSSGGLIQATDYNGFASSVNTLWGTGSGNYGYGQSTTVPTVAATTDTVTATQWATLIARMQSMQQHQSNNTTGVPGQPTAGGIVTYLSTVSTCITTITTNRLQTNAGYGTPITAAHTNATGWTTSATKTYTFTFASANQARYFFNCGGYLSLNTGGTTMSANSKSTYWSSFLTAGLNYFNLFAGYCTRGGTGYTQNTFLSSQGFYNLTTTPVVYLQLTDSPSSADYTSNYLQVLCSVNAGGTVVTITLYAVDAAADTFDDTVTGTFGTTGYIGVPETTYISNTWGTPTIANTVNTQS